MATRTYIRPNMWVRRGGTWPTGPWKRGTPRYARVTAAIVTRIEAARDGRPVRTVAEAAGIAHTSLLRLIAGDTVPDAGTITALEHALSVDLWPGRDLD